MDEQDVYFVDDERNAIVPQRTVWGRPMPRPAVTRVPPQRHWIQPQRPYYPQPQPYYPQAQPQRPVIIVQRAPNLFAGLDLGELVDRGVSVVAAMQSLPDAPSVTGKPDADVANMIVYQEALADHTKADERLRAFGGLAAQVVKVLVKNAQQQKASPLGMLGGLGGFGIGG